MDEPSRDEVILPTGGACMRPWIWPDGRLRVRRCRPEDLTVGDIAVWFDGSRLLSHRVVELKPHGAFTTRGDLCLAPDLSIESHQLVGTAVGFAKGPINYRLDGTWIRQVGRVAAAVALWVRRAKNDSKTSSGRR